MTQAQLPQQLGDTQVSRQVRSRKKTSNVGHREQRACKPPSAKLRSCKTVCDFQCEDSAEKTTNRLPYLRHFWLFHSTSSLCAVVFRVWSKILCDFTSSEFRFPARSASSITLRGIGEGDGPLQVFAIAQGNPLRPACVLMGIG